MIHSKSTKRHMHVGFSARELRLLFKYYHNRKMTRHELAELSELMGEWQELFFDSIVRKYE